MKAHENVHDIAANNREGYAKMESIVMDTLESLGLDEETLMDAQRALAPNENEAYWREEIVANTVPSILSDEATLKEFVQKMAGADADTRSAFVKFLDTMRDFLRNAFDKLKNELSWQQMQIISENQQAIERIRDAYFEALDGLKGKNEADVDGANSSVRTSKADTQFSEDKYYKTKISNWEELKDGKRVKVGVVQKGSALNQVGFPNTSMYFDVGKIKKALSDHSDHLDSDVLRAIPSVLNDPIVIAQYSEDTANVFGNLFVKGKPVVVGVVMTRGRDNTTIVNKIRTIHARSDVQKLVNDNSILYLNPDKKRTRKWFQVCDNLNVPLEGTRYGLIRTIAYSEAADNRKVHFSMQDAVEETDKLLAIHNLTGSQMNGVLELGGFPMPSIAVLKATQGHDRYGDVSVVFDKATINPETNRLNKVYGGDAWTPNFPAVEYEVNSKAAEAIRRKYYELAKRKGYDFVRPMYTIANTLEDELNRRGGVGAIISDLEDDTRMMNVFLEDSGAGAVEDIISRKTTRIPDETVQRYVKRLLDMCKA